MFFHQLRSGKIYRAVTHSDSTMSRSPSPVTSSLTGQQPTSSSVPAANTPTIKLLHQEPSLKRFSGEDSAHSPLTFLQQCEDVMRNSSIVEDADKISFIRSQLVQDSLATVMMRANCFNTAVIGCSYAKFRENFLTTFGTSQDNASLQWSFRLADSLTTDLGNLGILKGQAYAADFANEAISALQSANWSENGKISLDRLRTVFEFQYYIMYLAPQERRVASTLDFKPDQSLMEFASKLSKRVRDSPKAPVVPVAPVQGDCTASSPPPPPPTPPPHASKGSHNSGRRQSTRTPTICTFCGKSGHKWSQCFQRKKQAAQDASQRLPCSSASSSALPTNFKSLSQYSSAPSKPTHAAGASHALMMNLAPPQPVPKWCIIHEFGNHTTDECFAILRLKRNQVATAAMHKPSGEASRPTPNHPT